MNENVNLKIREYREIAGMTQEALGERLGVTRQTVGAWEKGESVPTLAQLFRLAQAVGVQVDLLLGRTAPSGPALLFRSDDPAALRPELRSLLERQAVNYAAVERVLGEVPLLPESRPIDGYDPEVVEHIAQEMREWLGVEEGPLYDVLSLLEAKGLKVILHPLPEEVSGLSAYTDELCGVIFVNQNHPTERQHFTALHELGHLIFHRREYQGPIKKSTMRDPKEKAANQFAGALLLPREVLEKELRSYRQRWIPDMVLRDIKLRYRVSMRAVLVRAAQAGLISQQQAGQQIGVLNKTYGKENEPVTLPKPEGLARLTRLVFGALINEKITTSRAAEILERPLLEVRAELSRWTLGEPV